MCLCLQSLPSLPHLEAGDIRGCSWNGGRRALVFHNAGSADASLSQDSSLVIHTHVHTHILVTRGFKNLKPKRLSTIVV